MGGVPSVVYLSEEFKKLRRIRERKKDVYGEEKKRKDKRGFV